MWNKIEASAPGKIILHGEHAVVFGKAAVAVSLGLKTQVTLIPNETKMLSLNFKNLNMQIHWAINDVEEIFSELNDVENLLQPSAFMDKILQLFDRSPDSQKIVLSFQKLSTTIYLFLYLGITKLYMNKVIPIDVTVETQLSLGAGMGSSASYAVCLSAALLSAADQISNNLNNEDIKKISEWAFGAETIAHGQPSGIDNSICSYGGALLFKDRKIICTLPNIPQLKILLVDTGIERNTSQLVANMKQKLNCHPTTISHIMNAIDTISLESWEILNSVSSDKGISEKLPLLQELIKINHYLLNSLDVSHPKLNEICNIAELFNYAAKLTGAGGGGCAFIILPPHNGEDNTNIEKLKDALVLQNFKFWDVSLGGPGVTVIKS